MASNAYNPLKLISVILLSDFQLLRRNETNGTCAFIFGYFNQKPLRVIVSIAYFLFLPPFYKEFGMNDDFPKLHLKTL